MYFQGSCFKDYNSDPELLIKSLLFIAYRGNRIRREECKQLCQKISCMKIKQLLKFLDNITSVVYK